MNIPLFKKDGLKDLFTINDQNRKILESIAWEVKNLDLNTEEELYAALKLGGRFIVYGYNLSALIVTYKRFSPAFFILPGESKIKPGLYYSFFALFFGVWAIRGSISTLQNLVINFGGGLDVTEEIMIGFREGKWVV